LQKGKVLAWNERVEGNGILIIIIIISINVST